MDKCELIDKCGFFGKYKETKELACKGFIARFCKGQDMDKCQRKAYRKEHGQAPPDDMMPSGQMMKA